MIKFQDKYPEATIDNKHPIQEFVDQKDITDILGNIQQLRSQIIDLICEGYKKTKYLKQSVRSEIFRSKQYSSLFLDLDGKIVDLFETVLPPLLPNKTITEYLLEATSNDRLVIEGKLKVETMFAVSVIEETELTYLINFIIEMSSVLKSEFVGELKERKLKNINKSVYKSLIKARSEIISL